MSSSLLIHIVPKGMDQIMQINYTVLENGLDFILKSVEDLSSISKNALDSKANKRYIKYSLLHLSSGIELVLKSKLLQEHWTYVYKDMNAANRAKFESGEFESVGGDKIIERLKNLCDTDLEAYRAVFHNLRKKRNKAEHFRLDENILPLKSSIHNCIRAFVNIITKHYNTSAFTDDERSLLLEIKTLLYPLKEHYEDALKIVKKDFKESGMEHMAHTCPKCYDTYLLINYDDDGMVKCSSCSYEGNSEDAARLYISKVIYYFENDIAIVDSELPLYDCPDCNDWTFAYDAVNDDGICFSCGFNARDISLSFCNKCGKQIAYEQYLGEESISCPECGEDIPYE